jgi:ABC-type antimicrobial peptide transport system permease subunit
MGIQTSFLIAWRSISRRKTKNLSVILAVALGVTLLVGIQITTDTLENAFLTSLLQSEGEVDIRILNSTSGGYLTASELEQIGDLIPDAVGIMPELSTQIPALVESQFDPNMELAGIYTGYSDVFGTFYDWKTGDEIDLGSLLVDNRSILMSSDQAEKLGLDTDTSLPFTLTTEFTNLTKILISPPLVPLSNWTINPEFTNSPHVLISTPLGLHLELQPTNFTSMVTAFTFAAPNLRLSDYAYVNVTVSGTSNALLTLGFSLDDGSSVYVANLTSPSITNTVPFDLTPYSDRILRGDVFISVMSANGTQASVDITEIAFETPNLGGSSRLPTISFTPELERVELTVTGFFDSIRPGIGSQYSGAILKMEYLQSWLSLQDPLQNTDLVSAYLIAFKTDHFTEEISEEFLEIKVEELEEIIPEEIDINTGEPYKIYQIMSPRLTFFGIAGFFITLLSTILSSLGLLITLTGLLLITNVQLMSVEDREFQTGVLRAVGENRRGIFQSIIIENLFQGIIGGIIGLFGGLAFGQGVAMYLVSLFGTGELSVQPVISQEAIVLSVIVGIILSIITGILPALRASRVNIVDALRGLKVKFEAKSSRNLVALGILMILLGVFLLLNNGVLDETTQVFWNNEGWDTLSEWRNLLLGFGSLTAGMGLVLSRFINRVKAFNITAIALWAIPTFLFMVAMGNWITDVGSLSIDILIIGIGEIVIGSILFVSLNLPIVMRGLRKFLIKIKGMKGVAEISPALISSHITRSTLTFAIFAIILTLNVLVATLIPTSLGTVTELEADSKGIDFVVFLNKPETLLNATSFSEELYKIDSRITDVIGLKTFKPNQDFTKFIALNDPSSSEFDFATDLLPLRTGEFKSTQIRGNATDYTEDDWRYAFYLSSFPDGIRESYTSDLSDSELLGLSKQSWDQFFNISYQMAAYNVSSSLLSVLSGESDISDLQIGPGGGEDPLVSDGDSLEGEEPLGYANGTIIKNPIVFTDSFLLPIGMQVWIPMNVSSIGLPNYQAFTIGGGFDNQRAGGFPLGSGLNFGGGESDFGAALGSIYLPEYWANQTNFLGEANNQSLTSRVADQYDTYLIKTSLSIDNLEIEQIAQSIQEFTNTNDEGYRLLSDDNFYVTSTALTYARVEQTLELTSRITSFLQIYVTFGLAIGAVGMGVISVRNVAERKREIGMMRAIGFPKAEVILSVLLELVVLGIIGLVIGVIDGLIISQGFANMQNMALVIPWDQIGIYLSFIVLIAIGAGSIPAFVAARIPPAEALRYVG